MFMSLYIVMENFKITCGNDAKGESVIVREYDATAEEFVLENALKAALLTEIGSEEEIVDVFKKSSDEVVKELLEKNTIAIEGGKWKINLKEYALNNLPIGVKPIYVQ